MTLAPETLALVDAERNLSDYLEFNGWSRISEGSFGILWTDSDREAEIAVPRGLKSGTGMWDGTIDRIAQRQNKDSEEVDKSVRRFWMDVSDFRATSSVVQGNYIAAEAGSSLFSGAWRILRSSATTARGAKVAISGNYSSAGDRSIKGAVFAQTEPGSYVLPLLVPIDRALLDEQMASENEQERLSSDDFFETRTVESEQRRATRTMAQALSAIYQRIIAPAKEPTQRAINEAVMAGASREMLTALHDIINEPTVSRMDVKFHWAPRAGVVPSINTSVEIPKESAILLANAAKQMKATKEPTTAVLSGPIFALYHPKGLDRGEATIEAAHHGRVRLIVVTLKGAKALDDAHRWFRAHETLVVQGAVRSTSLGLKVDAPTLIYPLGQGMLFDA